MEFDREDFLKAAQKLKITTIALICLYALSFIINPEKLDKQLAAMMVAIFSIIWLILKIMLVFRIRFVQQRVHKGVVLLQLAVLFIPIADIILPWVVLKNANKYLSDQEKISK